MVVDTETHKKKLSDMLSLLTTELQTIGIHNPEVKEDWIATPEGVEVNEADPNVAADRVEEWDERRAIVATLETRYNNITRALTKIEKGEYGFCEVCKKEIESDRLTINPAARTCKEHLEDETGLSA
jgi:RNA polymerase-binding transcription factor DksA